MTKTLRIYISPKRCLSLFGALLLSSVMLSACGSNTGQKAQGSTKDYLACYQLGLFDTILQSSSVGVPVPESQWTDVADAAMKASSASIVKIGRSLQTDVPLAQSGGPAAPVASDMLDLFRACEALAWPGTGDPAVNGPGVDPSSAPTGGTAISGSTGATG